MGPFVGLVKALNSFRVRVPEPLIDRLVLIAYDGERCAPREKVNEALLRLIHVLILVHEHVVKTRALGGGRVRPEIPQGEGYDLIDQHPLVKPKPFLQRPLKGMLQCIRRPTRLLILIPRPSCLEGLEASSPLANVAEVPVAREVLKQKPFFTPVQNDILEKT